MKMILLIALKETLDLVRNLNFEKKDYIKSIVHI